MPVLFVGHGSPMNVGADNEFTRSLKALGSSLPRPEAILVISAHWLTRGTRVLCQERPRTIHDFYGFPDSLYSAVYPALGAPQVGQDIVEKVSFTDVTCDYEWGFDHASWAILGHIYPDHSVPVVEMSLDYGFGDWRPKAIDYHYQLGKELAFLRDEGVLIVGSGNIVHNLRLIDMDQEAPVVDWARELDELVKEHLLSGRHDQLIDLSSMGDAARIGIPTWDHYLPMIYAIGLQEEEDISFFHEGFQHGTISMRGFRLG